MGATTSSFTVRNIAVQPGGEAVCSLVLRNTGTVVDEFSIDVLGDARPWAQVEVLDNDHPEAVQKPPVSIYPDDERTVVVHFRPPRSPHVPAGVVPFGIRVSSREDPAGSVIEEGTLEIEPFLDIRVELVPRTVRGRRQGKCEVAVDNLGNRPVDLDVDADDPERALRFRPEHTALTLQPGTTAFIGLTVIPERRFLRGQERTHPFQVRVSGADAMPVTAEGAMVQEPLLPKWVPIAIAALLAGLIGLALWSQSLRRDAQASAQEAAAAEVQGVANTAGQAKGIAQRVAQKVGVPLSPEEMAPPGGPAPPPSPAPSPAPSTPPPPGPVQAMEPIDFRITTDAATTSEVNAFRTFPVPDDDPLAPRFAGRLLTISDVVLQNPFGDNGTLHVLRVSGQGADRQETVLLEVGLSNFRDLDYHFLQPWQFRPGERVMLAVSCQNPLPEGGGPAANCRPSASFSGRLGPPPPPPSAPLPTPTATPGP